MTQYVLAEMSNAVYSCSRHDCGRC